DRPRAAQPDDTGGRVERTLPSALALGLRGLARAQGCTPFMAGLALFKLLLMRWGAGTDLPVGTVVSGREGAAQDRLVGHFVNMVVLRTKIDPSASLRELLARVRDTTLSAFVHQALPFDRLVQALQPERKLAMHPLCQTCFAWGEDGDATLELEGLDVQRIEVPSHHAKFDLMLSLQHAADGSLRARFEYRSALFERRTIERMAQTFACLLEAAVHAADLPVARLPLMPDAQRQALLRAWGHEPSDAFEDDRSLAACFEAQVLRTPAGTALVHEGLQLDYSQLNARANRLAHALIAGGIGHGAVVALHVPRGATLIVALLAIVKTGAAYMPLDLELPQERIAFMLCDARVDLVLYGRELMDALPADACPALCLDDLERSAQSLSEGNPPARG